MLKVSYKAMKRFLSVTFYLASVSIAFILGVAVGSVPVPPESTQVQRIYQLSDFNSIAEGMTVEQVTELMGPPSSVGRSGSSLSHWYMNPNGGNIIVLFEDGRVMTVSQAGIE